MQGVQEYRGPLPPGADDDYIYSDLSFRCHFGQNGVAELLPSLTINGVTETPVFRYIGGDADNTDWTADGYGETLTKAAGTALLNQGSPYLGADDDSVNPNGSAYYQESGTSFADITTEDLVVEAVVIQDVASNRIFARQDNINTVGYSLLGWGATNFAFDIGDGVNSANIFGPAGLTSGSIYYMTGFIDRDEASANGGLLYVNGSSGAGVDPSAVGSLTNGLKFTACARSDTGNIFSAPIMYLALYKRSSWMGGGAGNPTEWAAIHAERFGLLQGYWPQVAKGTSAPNTATRAYAAFSEKIESSKTRLYLMGSDALRISQRIDANGVTVTGYLAEPEAENDLGEWNDFSAWTKEDAGDVVTDDAATGPDGRTTAATLVCDNTNGNHGLSLASVGNLSADDHCMSVWVGAGNADWVKLVDSTVANAHCWFNVATGAKGTEGAGIDQASFVLGQYVGDADRRIHIRFDGTAAPHTILIRPCDGDGVDTFSGGDGVAVTLYLYGAQCEEGDYPTTGIETDGGATATRLKDQLQFKGDDGNLGGVGSEKRGTIEFDFLSPDYDSLSSKWFVSLSDGGSNDEFIDILQTSGEDVRYRGETGAVGQFDITEAVATCDNIKHRVHATWTTNDARLVNDGDLEGQDTSCSMPDDLDEIDIGHSRTATVQINSLISDLKIWRRNKHR